MKRIAYIETDFPEKFGIPRQSGLVPELTGRIVFEPEYRNMDAVRGLEAYSHIWILWEFEGVERGKWSPTVRPPRLGGNQRVGVFATRSPFRPNPIGLSSVKIEKIAFEEVGPVIYVSGIDMRDHTPIYDIKPYLLHVDSHPDAISGFAGEVKDYGLEVVFSEKLLAKIPVSKREACLRMLEQDPRPAYQKDSEREYGVSFAGFNIIFKVKDAVLTVYEVNSRLE